jgi:hypothetical protein
MKVPAIPRSARQDHVAAHTHSIDTGIGGVNDDVFHDVGMGIVVALLALVMLITLLGIGLVYYGDSIAVPSWNERSVPPPTMD